MFILNIVVFLKGEKHNFLNLIETEIDYEIFIKRPGLIVLDVYSNWCGPCFAMFKYLRNLFVNYSFTKENDDDEDLLHFGLCKVDNIKQLNIFSNNSEPTWIFINVK